jgi:hypothetical protein
VKLEKKKKIIPKIFFRVTESMSGFVLPCLHKYKNLFLQEENLYGKNTAEYKEAFWYCQMNIRKWWLGRVK